MHFFFSLFFMVRILVLSIGQCQALILTSSLLSSSNIILTSSLRNLILCKEFYANIYSITSEAL